MSMKVMQRTAAQRDDEKREAYWRGLDTFVSDWRMLVFADEIALDGRVMRRRRGWGGTSKRVRVVEMFHRGEMISVLAMYTYEGFARYTYTRGAFDSDKFMLSMQMMLPDVIRPVPEPCSVLVLDNCAIHKKYEDELRELVERQLGGVLVYLAPYCCVDSPIEFGFNAFKNTWKAHGRYLDSLEKDDAIQWAIRNAYKGGAVGSATAARGTYATCGYVDRFPAWDSSRACENVNRNIREYSESFTLTEPAARPSRRLPAPTPPGPAVAAVEVVRGSRAA